MGCSVPEIKNTLELVGKDLQLKRRGAVVKSVEHNFDNIVRQYLSGAGSSPAGSVDRDLYLQKLSIHNH